MRSGNPDQILSQPLRLFWNGWESNTHALQRAGWELSVSEDIQRMKMAIAMRHEQAGVRGFSDFIDFEYLHKGHNLYNTEHVAESYPTFNCKLAHSLNLQLRNLSPQTYKFNPIDAQPMYHSIEFKSLDDLAHFRKLETPGNEIFLKRASMDDILNMALSKQEPRQEAIRKEMIRREELDVMRSSLLKANLRLVA